MLKVKGAQCERKKRGSGGAGGGLKEDAQGEKALNSKKSTR